MKPIFFVLLVSVLFVFPAHGEIYKWTDKNGKVHYSDKPVPNTRSSDVVGVKDRPIQVVDVGFPRPLPETPIKKNPDIEIKELYISIEDYPWQPFANTPYKKIGGFLKGQTCNFFEEKRWRDMFNEFSSLLPNNIGITNTAQQVMFNLGYTATPIEMKYLARMQRDKAAYALVPTIKGIRYDSCVTKPRKHFFSVWRKRAKTDFNRHRAAITVEWNLKDPEGKVVYTKTLQGVSDRMDLDMQGPLVVLEAIDNTVSNLFSDKEFVGKLKDEKGGGFFSKFF